MVQRRSGRRSRVAATSRKFVWARQEINQIVNGESSAAINLFGNFETEYGAQLLGSTVMRVRGMLELEPVAAVTGFAAAGIRVDLDGQAGNGPLTSKHLDWMAYFPLAFNPVDETAGRLARVDVDVKAARRVEELGEALHLVVQNPFVATAANFRGLISVGIKLP